MSNRSQELILPLGQECIELAERLCGILDREKRSVVSFDIDQLTNTVAEKQSVMARLKERREYLKRLVGIRFGKKLSEIGPELPEALAEEWRVQQWKWSRCWTQLVSKAESNQLLLKHSLKNMDMLLTHLKHLFGDPGIYNQTGKRQDLNSAGKVLEGRF